MARIEVLCKPWAGDTCVPKDEANVLLAHTSDVVVDGVTVECDAWAIDLAGRDFITITLSNPGDEFFGRLDPGQYLMGSTAGEVTLPVTDLILRSLC